MAYKPAISNLRNSPGLKIRKGLRLLGAHVEHHDPYVRASDSEEGVSMLYMPRPEAAAYDLVILTLLHPECDLSWLNGANWVRDCTYCLVRRRRLHLV